MNQYDDFILNKIYELQTAVKSLAIENRQLEQKIKQLEKINLIGNNEN